MSATPYATAARVYFDAGWSPLPVGLDEETHKWEPRRKASPPPGFTGNRGRMVTEADLDEFVRRHPDMNIGIRVPKNVSGIDVDAYGDKPGADTLLDLEDRHGTLPHTWLSTSRKEGISGIRLYRCETQLTLGKIPGIELVRFAHRFAVVSPSIHPEGRTYRWISPDGEILDGLDRIPTIDDLAVLPAPWAEHWSKKCECFKPAKVNGFDWTNHTEGTSKGDPVRRYVDEYLSAVASGQSCHDSMLDATLQLCSARLQRWPGAAEALDEVHSHFMAKVTAEGHPERRSRAGAQAEWERAMEGAERLAPSTTLPKWEDRSGATNVATVPGGTVPDRNRLTDAMTFVEQAAEVTEPLIGTEELVLWPALEPFLVAAKTGVGKTTFALAAIQARLSGAEFLGLPTRPFDKPHLFVAADRPRQIARAMARLTGGHEDVFRTGLKVWSGPLPFDLGKDIDAGTLGEFIEDAGCGSVTLDSYGNVASSLAKDEGGSAMNRQLQGAVAEGFDVLGLHHQRKATADNTKPRAIDDVYGSQWLTTGAGSVIYLHGQPGDLVVELLHLKQAVGEVGPMSLLIDPDTGLVTVSDERDPLVIFRRHRDGVFATDFARQWFEVPKPTASQKEKARRKLERFVTHGYATRVVDAAGVTMYRPFDGRLEVGK